MGTLVRCPSAALHNGSNSARVDQNSKPSTSTLCSSTFFFFFFFFFFFLLLLLLLLFLRRYNFRAVLALPTNSFHLDRFLMQSFQFVIFIFVTSLFTSSSHLFLGLPSDFVNAGVHSYTFFYHAVVWHTTYMSKPANLCALIWFIMFLLPISLFSSSFALIRHMPSLSLVGP
jgi:hypothetical protein